VAETVKYEHTPATRSSDKRDSDHDHDHDDENMA
jgi:hypothetical protein